MKRLVVGVALAVLAASPAWAALKVGDKAPDFTLPGAKAGAPFTYSLKSHLKQGPVVLYFFLGAFGSGCNIETHTFAEAADQYKALGASVIGVSRDEMGELTRFSSDTRYCSGKFPLAADAKGDVVRAYDAVFAAQPEYASRTSYVIAPNGKIIYEYTSLDPTKHVENTMAALKAWKAKGGKA